MRFVTMNLFSNGNGYILPVNRIPGGTAPVLFKDITSRMFCTTPSSHSSFPEGIERFLSITKTYTYEY